MFLDEARLAARIAHPERRGDARRRLGRGRPLPRDGVRAGRVAVAGVAHHARPGVSASRLSPSCPAIIAGVLCTGCTQRTRRRTRSRRAPGHRASSRRVAAELPGRHRRGRAGVLDFGIAKAAGRLQTTPARRSAQGKALVHGAASRSTARPSRAAPTYYAASVVLWEALSRRAPLQGDDNEGQRARQSACRAGAPAERDRRGSALVARPHRASRGSSAIRSKRPYATAREMAQGAGCELRGRVGGRGSATLGGAASPATRARGKGRAALSAQIESRTPCRTTRRRTIIPSSPGQGRARRADPPVGRREPEEPTGRRQASLNGPAGHGGGRAQRSRASRCRRLRRAAFARAAARRGPWIAIAASCAAVFLVAIGALVG